MKRESMRDIITIAAYNSLRKTNDLARAQARRENGTYRFWVDLMDDDTANHREFMRNEKKLANRGLVAKMPRIFEENVEFLIRTLLDGVQKVAGSNPVTPT